MKPWQFAAVGLALLAVSGCRVDPRIPVLERDLRLKEDEIYRLRQKVDDMQDCGTCQYRPSSSETRADSGSRDASSQGSGSRTNAATSAPANAEPPKIEFSAPAGSEVPDFLKSPAGPPSSTIPEVPENLRGPSSPGGAGKSSDATAPDGPALGGTASHRSHSPSVSRRLALTPQTTPALTASADNRFVQSIALNRALSGGVNDGNVVGDHGLLVVVEPRDANGRVLDAPAAINVVAWDPAVQGDAGRVARWDFTAEETAAMFRRTGAGPAIHIEATWPDRPPSHKKLLLFVRYTTADGRKLEANQPIEVALAGEKPARRIAQANDPSLAPETSRALQDASPSALSTAQRPTWSPERR